MFAYECRIRRRNADAAGVTLFAEQIATVHEVYEAFLENKTLDLRRLLVEGTVHLAVVPAEGTLRSMRFFSSRGQNT